MMMTIRIIDMSNAIKTRLREMFVLELTEKEKDFD
jgi:hypothetical protein